MMVKPGFSQVLITCVFPLLYKGFASLEQPTFFNGFGLNLFIIPSNLGFEFPYVNQSQLIPLQLFLFISDCWTARSRIKEVSLIHLTRSQSEKKMKLRKGPVV